MGMLEVKIDKIIPVTEARDSFNKLVDEVEASDELYVLTKNGKPSAVIVGVHHLEKLTGTSHEDLMGAAAGVATSGAISSVVADDNSSSDDDASDAPATPTDVAASETAQPEPIDLSNFPADDGENEPVPINVTADKADEAPANASDVSENIIPGITNVASDPTLSTAPFSASENQQTIGQSAASQSPMEAAPSGQTIGQRGFKDTAPATETAPEPSSPGAEDAPLEDPLDFLSNMGPTEQAQTPPAPVASASQATESVAPQNPANSFSDISEGPNGSTTPDDIVSPVQGDYSQANIPAAPAQPAQPSQPVNNQISQ